MEQADLRHHPLRDRRHGGRLHELEIFRQRETVATDPNILRMGGEIVGRRPAEEIIVVCLSGRGDKDAAEIARLRGLAT